MAPKVYEGIDGVKAAVGTHLGYSDWIEITQERINLFAEATGDFQWIHVDVERAKQSPFGGTIAHGYLTMSLVPAVVTSIARFEGFAMAINYGCDKVRFVSPVPVDSRVRGGVEIQSVTDVAGGIQVKFVVTIEIEGQEKPACVVEALLRWYV